MMENELADCICRPISIEDNPPTVLLCLENIIASAVNQSRPYLALAHFNTVGVRGTAYIVGTQHFVLTRLKPDCIAIFYRREVCEVRGIDNNELGLIQYLMR
jgi:hypothetical protein